MVGAMTTDFAILSERRTSPRFRFSVVMPAFLGRGDAMIVDISSDGARVLHFASLPLHGELRLMFSHGGRRFGVIARVLASRVKGLGDGPAGATTFESRLQFVDASAESAATLAQIIEQLEDERMQRWESNAAGHAPAGRCGEANADYFLRYRLLGGRWTKLSTRDSMQPRDGFTVPAKLSDHELRALCEAYEQMDAEGRELVRATAAHAA